MRNNYLIVIGIFLLQITFVDCDRDKSIDPKEENLIGNNQMVVYPNIGNVFYLINYQTFTVENTIKLDIPDSIGCFGMCLSTNKDFLIFACELLYPPFKQFIISYDIKKNTLHNISPTGLDSVGAPRITAAHLSNDPGLIYLYSHNVGLYSINFLSQEVNLISGEHGQSLSKFFYFTFDKKTSVILKQFGSEPAYSEVEFYNTSSGLKNMQFVLNKNNQDDIYISDLEFSENNKEIFISIRLPKMRHIANYFGSYDLYTKELYKSSLTLPWSINPYYLTYSSKRQEAYLVGEQDKFYIVDTSTQDYQLKAVVDLTGKIPGPSRVVLDPDKNICFVSCSSSNFILVIDLDKMNIKHRIQIDHPYLMILL